MFAYRNKMLNMLTRWAKSVPGSQLWATVTAIGEELNRVAFFARWSYLARLIKYADSETLIEHGKRRGLPRYVQDTTDTHRTRLLNAWDFYRSLGTSKSIVSVFGWIGYQAEVICNKDWPSDTWDGLGAVYDLARYDSDVYDTADTWDGLGASYDVSVYDVDVYDIADTWDAYGPPDHGTMWNRFWVRIYNITVDVDTWDSDTDTWDSDTDTWDGISSLVNDFTEIVLRCRAAHNLFVGFIFISPTGEETWVLLNKE